MFLGMAREEAREKISGAIAMPSDAEPWAKRFADLVDHIIEDVEHRDDKYQREVLFRLIQRLEYEIG